MDLKKVVEKYHNALKAGDFDTIRGLLAKNLDFRGPIAAHDNPEGLIKDLQGLAQIVEDLVERKTFVDGQDICVIYDLRTKVGLSPVAEWFHGEDGKINFIRVFFDARPFAPLFNK